MSLKRNLMHPFVDYLSAIHPPTVNSTNMYAVSSRCRHNLSLYIEQMLYIKPTILFIGEAPGYRGCGITGVPFTDEHTFAVHPFFMGRGYEFCNPPSQEVTAECVWSCIDYIVPLMWNIYPFHPFGENERTNRKPDGGEIRLGKEIAERFISLFSIEKIFSIGRTAQTFSPTAEYIRHPSHGGQTKFKKLCRMVLKESLPLCRC